MPFSGYLEFLARQRRFVAFGFVMAFASSFGQTYFIGIFGPGIQAEFDLSHTLWGAIYMVGTIASALLLPWSGRRIDTLDLRTYPANLTGPIEIGLCLVHKVSAGRHLQDNRTRGLWTQSVSPRSWNFTPWDAARCGAASTAVG